MELENITYVNPDLKLGPRQQEILHIIITRIDSDIRVKDLKHAGIPDEIARKILHVFSDRGILIRKKRGVYSFNKNLLLK